MKILAIDTAMGAVSACVSSGDGAVPLSGETIAMQRGHAEALLPLIDRVIAAVPGGFGALERVAVTIGPGSFTGIRVGIAAARAIGLACDIPVVGISTLSALAAPHISASETMIVASAVDAHHGNVYIAAYVMGGRSLLSPRLLSVKDAVRQLGSGPVKLTGSGAPLLAIEAWSSGLNAEVVGDLVAPDIAYVARLGLLTNPEQAPASPLYLKAPDAKPQEGGRIARVPSTAMQE